MKLKKRTIKKLEKAGFSYRWYEGDKIHGFAKSSPRGQDFWFELDDEAELADLVRAVKEYYEAYDPSYEAYLWLDETGHGKNGAPYDMKELYEDMEACEQYIDDVFEILYEEAYGK